MNLVWLIDRSGSLSVYLSVQQHGDILEVHTILLYHQHSHGSYICIPLQPCSLSSDKMVCAVRGGFNVLSASPQVGLHESISFSIHSTFTIPPFINCSSSEIPEASHSPVGLSIHQCGLSPLAYLYAQQHPIVINAETRRGTCSGRSWLQFQRKA